MSSRRLSAHHGYCIGRKGLEISHLLAWSLNLTGVSDMDETRMMVDNLCPDCLIDTIIQGDALTVLKAFPDEFIFAYCAGIVDGEGYVGIKRSTYGMRKRDDVKSPTFSERVQIRMSDRNVLELFQKVFGGALTDEKKVYQSRSGFKTGKKMYCYRATDRVAANLIQSIFPYLIVKRKQADLVLQLRISKDSKEARMKGGRTQKRAMSIDVLAKRQNLYSRIKEIHGH